MHVGRVCMHQVAAQRGPELGQKECHSVDYRRPLSCEHTHNALGPL